MERTHKSHRYGPAGAAAAALGLAATIMLAPAAQADADADRPAEVSSAVAVPADPAEGAEGLGAETPADNPAVNPAEAAVDIGGEVAEQPVAEVVDDEGGEAVAVPSGPPALEDTTPPVDAGTDGNCADEQAAAPTATDPADTASDPRPEAADGSTGVDGAPSAVGSVVVDDEGTSSDCQDTTPVQAGEDPGAPADGTQLPVGGVDAGVGEAAGQSPAPVIAAAVAASATVGLGAYLLLRRSRGRA